jgi:hypothetical protein
MPSRSKKSKAAITAAELASIAKARPYIERVIEDATLRDNIRTAVDSTRSAYGRLTNGKTPAKALVEDKKLQADLRDAADALREASAALSDAPKKRAKKKKGPRLGRKLLILAIGAGLALALSEGLRNKVLDTLFGAEEEFEYTPPPAASPAQPTAPVSAA